ncbi:uncharacterized protein LOC135495319 [Lineus longissimus]|uniref:uncharacterized protein LOC135495319 n=1 Tax=Lineus longissimus TaxID=88925 RepID=UPI00315C586E
MLGNTFVLLLPALNNSINASPTGIPQYCPTDGSSFTVGDSNLQAGTPQPAGIYLLNVSIVCEGYLTRWHYNQVQVTQKPLHLGVFRPSGKVNGVTLYRLIGRNENDGGDIGRKTVYFNSDWFIYVIPGDLVGYFTRDGIINPMPIAGHNQSCSYSNPEPTPCINEVEFVPLAGLVQSIDLWLNMALEIPDSSFKMRFSPLEVVIQPQKRWPQDKTVTCGNKEPIGVLHSQNNFRNLTAPKGAYILNLTIPCNGELTAWNYRATVPGTTVWLDLWRPVSTNDPTTVTFRLQKKFEHTATGQGFQYITVSNTEVMSGDRIGFHYEAGVQGNSVISMAEYPRDACYLNMGSVCLNERDFYEVAFDARLNDANLEVGFDHTFPSYGATWTRRAAAVSVIVIKKWFQPLDPDSTPSSAIPTSTQLSPSEISNPDCYVFKNAKCPFTPYNSSDLVDLESCRSICTEENACESFLYYELTTSKMSTCYLYAPACSDEEFVSVGQPGYHQYTKCMHAAGASGDPSGSGSGSDSGSGSGGGSTSAPYPPSDAPLSCSDDVLQSIGNSTAVNTQPRKALLYLMNITIPCEGLIEQWRYYQQAESNNTVQVGIFRRSGVVDGHPTVRIIGRNEITSSGDIGNESHPIAPWYRIYIKPGDLIGLIFESSVDQNPIPIAGDDLSCSRTTAVDCISDDSFYPIAKLDRYNSSLWVNAAVYLPPADSWFRGFAALEAIVRPLHRNVSDHLPCEMIEPFGIVNANANFPNQSAKRGVYILDILIPCDGVIKDWLFFAEVEANIVFDVWRKVTSPKGDIILVLIDKLHHHITKRGHQVIRVVSNRTKVLAGDMIGFHYEEEVLNDTVHSTISMANYPKHSCEGGFTSSTSACVHQKDFYKVAFSQYLIDNDLPLGDVFLPDQIYWNWSAAAVAVGVSADDGEAPICAIELTIGGFALMGHVAKEVSGVATLEDCTMICLNALRTSLSGCKAATFDQKAKGPCVVLVLF